MHTFFAEVPGVPLQLSSVWRHTRVSERQGVKVKSHLVTLVVVAQAILTCPLL